MLLQADHLWLETASRLERRDCWEWRSCQCSYDLVGRSWRWQMCDHRARGGFSEKIHCLMNIWGWGKLMGELCPQPVTCALPPIPDTCEITGTIFRCPLIYFRLVQWGSVSCGTYSVCSGASFLPRGHLGLVRNPGSQAPWANRIRTHTLTRVTKRAHAHGL